MLRALRIAGLSICLIACSLIVVMWIRSYKQMDDAYIIPSGKVGAYSVHGLFNVVFYSVGDPHGVRFSTMQVSQVPPAHFQSIEVDTTTLIRVPLYRRENAIRSELVLPYWVLFAVFAAGAATFGVRRLTRFSLRQFGIAIAAVATILAVGVVVSRIG